VPGQVELDVEGQAGVAGGEHEAVPAGPGRIGRVVADDPLEEQVRGGCEAHGGTGVAVAGLLHGVHGQSPDGVDRAAVEFGPVQCAVGHGGRAPPRSMSLSPPTLPIRCSPGRADLPPMWYAGTLGRVAAGRRVRCRRYTRIRTRVGARTTSRRDTSRRDKGGPATMSELRRANHGLSRLAERAAPSPVAGVALTPQPIPVAAPVRPAPRREVIRAYVSLTKPK